MDEPKKKRVTIAQRKARAAYYIRNRTVTCEHCEDYPFLVEAHDALAQKNRHLKLEVKRLMGIVCRMEHDQIMLEHRLEELNGRKVEDRDQSGHGVG